MKQILLFLLASVLVLSLAACGGAVVDYDTPKSGELSAAYDYYRDSQASLASGMAITPEQADDAFLVLVACGMDSKVSNVSRKQGDDGHCTVTSSFSTFDVYYTDGVIDRVEKGGEQLYPAPAPTEPDVIEPDGPTEPAAPATLEEAINTAIESANAVKEDISISDDGNVEIYLSGKDNLSVDLIRKGMWLQASNIFEALQDRDDISQIFISWSFPMLDAYGNSFEDTVMTVTVSKATLDKINFERFDFNSIPTIADDYFQHRLLNDE